MNPTPVTLLSKGIRGARCVTEVDSGALILTLHVPEPVMATQPSPAMTKSTAASSHPRPRTCRRNIHRNTSQNSGLKRDAKLKKHYSFHLEFM